MPHYAVIARFFASGTPVSYRDRLFALVAVTAVPTSLVAATDSIRLAMNARDCTYSIGTAALPTPVLTAGPAAKIDGRWLHAKDYPSCKAAKVPATGPLGPAEDWTIAYNGLQGAPDLLLHLRSYTTQPWGELQLTARNSTGQPVKIQVLRLIDASGDRVLNIGGDPATARILNDSFSEDRPGMQIHDLAASEKQSHRAVGSQLLYDQESGRSWFVGTLTSDRFLSVLRLHMAADHGSRMRDYEVDSTGTTELLLENSLADSSADDRVELSLPLAPAAELSSERMAFSISQDYHAQLETYGRLIRDLHQPRAVSTPTPLGWWSWTAYYFGLNQGTALTNAQWLAEHLKRLGYTFFHMDEGYQFARGEYATPDAALFPNGVTALEQKAIGLGLTPGIWTAPFEVSERSWVFANHPEWLVHNAKGAPIHIGLVADGQDHLYALDPTHPAAQGYLKQTYATLAHDWGIRYIKMDFMEDSAIEGFYHVPNTTALEAQRIGIRTVREAVGQNVLLDKDGCELLNPVGLVDMGRISQDTGHTFAASKDAAPGMAARYYMNRNYFIADPDAFSISRQTVDDQSWHGGQKPLTLDEAKVSIALTAITGGMFEIGDDLPTLGEDRERVALLENRDLLDMARLGRASIPLDLMSYAAADQQPSLFLLHEDGRQTILSVFNWTDAAHSHSLSRQALGLDPQGNYSVAEILTPGDPENPLPATLDTTQPAHSVRMFRIIDTRKPATAPTVTISAPTSARAGETIALTTAAIPTSAPLLSIHWEFGDGTSSEGTATEHTWTHAGTYTVHAHALGLSGAASDQTATLNISGTVVTKFLPDDKRRLVGKP